MTPNLVQLISDRFTRAELGEILRTYLGRNIEEVVPDGSNLHDAIYSILDAAVREGWDSLFLAALKMYNDAFEYERALYEPDTNNRSTKMDGEIIYRLKKLERDVEHVETLVRGEHGNNGVISVSARNAENIAELKADVADLKRLFDEYIRHKEGSAPFVDSTFFRYSYSVVVALFLSAIAYTVWTFLTT